MKPGDVVRLKSGSARMVVRAVDGQLCELTWFHDGQIVGIQGLETCCLEIDPGERDTEIPAPRIETHDNSDHEPFGYAAVLKRVMTGANNGDLRK